MCFLAFTKIADGILLAVAQFLFSELTIEVERVVLATGDELFLDQLPLLSGKSLRLI